MFAGVFRPRYGGVEAACLWTPVSSTSASRVASMAHAAAPRRERARTLKTARGCIAGPFVRDAALGFGSLSSERRDPVARRRRVVRLHGTAAAKPCLDVIR